VEVSALGFGAMRLPEKNGRVDREPAIAMLRRGFELGINYFDTAPYYHNGESEEVLGEALAGIRDKVSVSTKCPMEVGPDKWLFMLEQSLRRLRTDRIDFYHCWGINRESFTSNIEGERGFLTAVGKARTDGTIRHLSFSFHDNPQSLIRIIDAGIFETMLVQYNLLDRANEGGIAHARSRGLGVAVMGPVGGGRLGPPAPAIQRLVPGGVRSTAEMALRFVFYNPNIDVALSGMSSMAQVEENVALAANGSALDREELARVIVMMEENRRLADLYCTGCNYCKPCPQEIDIPEIFKIYNYYRLYGIEDAARGLYAALAPDGPPWSRSAKADACEACGQCESKCPQALPIIERLREAHAALG
jgi:predicted aldo/keto reductase-like oxidoreductase